MPMRQFVKAIDACGCNLCGSMSIPVNLSRVGVILRLRL